MSEHTPSCSHLIASLSEYVDGTLDSALCTELERHLHECHNCRVVVNTLRKTIELYHTTQADATTPPGVRERLFHRLDLDQYIR